MTMREIPVTEVRVGDIVRSNGKELRVEGNSDFVYGLIPRDLATLGVTFWREEQKLPDYPGAAVASRDGHRRAVRSRDRGGDSVLWLTTAASVPWKTEPQLLEWIGPDWWETTTPPESEWVPVDADQIRAGDFVRFECKAGHIVEGDVAADGPKIKFYTSASDDNPGKWFKREEQTDASE